MDSKSAAQQQGPAAMPRQSAGQKGVVPAQLVSLPEGPGGCIVGNTNRGVYKIAHSLYLRNWMSSLQSQTDFPLGVIAWMHGSHADSKRQQLHLRYIFRKKWIGDGWFTLSADHLAEARAYLAGEKERLEWEAERPRREAARAKEQAEKDVDGCIRRLRMMAEFVRHFSGQERKVIRSTWPQQQKTDEFLQLVDRFHAMAGKFDTALSRWAMEIQLDRMPKSDDAVAEFCVSPEQK
jgi:hypothetical protein